MKDELTENNPDLEKIEAVCEDINSVLRVLRSNQIERKIILDDIRKRMEPLGLEMSDQRILKMTDRDFEQLFDNFKRKEPKREFGIHYEKIKMNCRNGDILRNSNGSYYRVVEKYSDSNILFQDKKSGTFVVGVGVEYFIKQPKTSKEETEELEKFISDCCFLEYGIEADFSDYPAIVLMNEVQKGIGEVGAYADIDKCTGWKTVNGKTVDVKQYTTMEDFCDYIEEVFDRDTDIYLPDDALAIARGEKKLKEKKPEVLMEWGRGIYLPTLPSAINFTELKRQYGDAPGPNERGEYDIEIREVLSRTESVKAGYLGEAIDELMDKYKRGEIVLDADDFKGVDYIPVQGRGGYN